MLNRKINPFLYNNNNILTAYPTEMKMQYGVFIYLVNK